jgi:hypothetical protein
MSQNPYLINTGGLFGLTWEKSLKDSYAFSQIIYITNLLKPLDLEKIEDFKQEDFHNYVTCKKLVQNLESLMQNKLYTMVGYQTLLTYYKPVSKKIKDYVFLKKTKYDEATVNFNCFITDKLKYQERNASFQLDTIKDHIRSYFNLCTWLGIWKDDPNNGILSLLQKIKEQKDLNESFFNENAT